MSLKERFKYWKDEPDESPYKRLYDEHTMDFDKFLHKHYSDQTYFSWSRWNKWITWIENAYDEEKMESLRNRGSYYRVDTISKDYVESLSNLQLEIDLPNDIRCVIAFLVVDGFFSNLSIKPSAWIRMNNYANKNPTDYSTNHRIIDLTNSNEKLNYLRESLIHLPWWDITRGDPQGR